jgi:hypothetical protein
MREEQDILVVIQINRSTQVSTRVKYYYVPGMLLVLGRIRHRPFLEAFHSPDRRDVQLWEGQFSHFGGIKGVIANSGTGVCHGELHRARCCLRCI